MNNGSLGRASSFDVGNFGTGLFTISNGGTLNNDFAAFIGGGTSGTSGTATVTGPGSFWNNGGHLYVGAHLSGGVGALRISDRGVVQAGALRVSNTGSVEVNNGQSTVAGLILTGGASQLALGGDLGSLIVANNSSGRMIVINGGVARNSVGVVGRGAGQTGTVTVDGSGSRWINSGDVIVGESGNGTLEIRSGGAVSNLRGHVGFNTGSSGTVIVRDPGSSWTGSGSFFIGNSGIGSLQVLDGATASTAGNSYLGFSPGASGSAIVSGAGSTWSTAARLVIGGNLAEAGGAGSLRVEDGGVVTATGGVTNRFPGTVRGDGTIIGNVTNEGVVAPGKSTGTLHVTGNFDHFLSATLQIELASPASFDKLDVTGNVNLGGDFFGGTLQVALIDGFVPHGIQSFDILDWGGSLGGSFVSIQLPTLGGSLTWDTSQLYTTGVLSVTGPANPAGDFNDDGQVDAADYVVWRNEIGTPAGYDMWRANFGAAAIGSGTNAGPASSADAAVPEPGSLVLAAVLLGSVMMVRRVAKAMIRSAEWAACFFTTRGLAMRSIALLATTSLAFFVGENAAFAQAGDQLVTLCFRNRTIQVPFYLVNRYTANGATIGPCPTSTTSWLVDGAEDWFVSGNWSAGVPGAATNAQINNGGTTQIVDPSAAARNFSLGNMFEGSGTLEVLGGAAAFNDIDVGLVGAGTLLIGNGGQVSVAANGIIGDGPVSSGTATVYGANSKWINVGSLDVGNNGRGTLGIQNSGAVANTNGYIGHFVDSIGTATVDGVGSTWTNSGDLYVGHTGSGTLSVINGGKVSNFNANIGAVSSSDSTARVDGPGSVWTNNSVLAVGSSGAARYRSPGAAWSPARSAGSPDRPARPARS